MQLIIDILCDYALFVIIANGFSICYRVHGFFHMAHAISLTLAAYLVYTTCILWRLPMLVSILLSVALVVILMLLINKCVYLRGKKNNFEGWQLMIISLGIYVVLQNVVSMIWDDSTLTFRTWEVKQGHSFLGGVITNVQIVTIFVSLMLLLCVWLILEKTNIGKRLKAVSSNPTLSTVFGVRWEAITSFSLALGTALMACAGILIAADVDMTPTMGFDWLLYGVVAMIIGGMGRTRYLVLGALLLATAQHLAAYFLDSKWMNATAYIILVIFLYFRPYGFSGRKLKKTEV